MAKILIVEDDREMSEILKKFLEHSGYEVDCVWTGEACLGYLRSQKVDLIILDIALPDVRGEKLCVEIRGIEDCPIIFVSCVSDTETIVDALENGGDDYLVKPVDYDQLLARIHVKLRKKGGIVKVETNSPSQICFWHFTLDKNRRKVTCQENDEVEEIALSPIEYSILLYMLENPNRLLLYSELYENIWECESLGDVRTVMVHVSNLRKKIDLRRSGMITTVRRAGYIFNYTDDDGGTEG